MVKLARYLSFWRASVGLGALLAPGAMVALFGFPKEHDNASTRMVARLFGLRELSMAGLTLALNGDRDRRGLVYSYNAALDGADAAAALLTLAARRGIGRAALGAFLIAVPQTIGWLYLAHAETKPAE